MIVLAGGKSTRLGRDKASEVLAGKSLLQHALDACDGLASRFVIVVAQHQRLPDLSTDTPVQIVEDAYPETGPLGAIYTGLITLRDTPPATAALTDESSDIALVVACDMPLLQPALLRELLRLASDRDAAVPIREGQPEPLCAVYSTACIESARLLLERGAYKVAGILDVIGARMVPESDWRHFDPDGLSFLNVNREEDLALAKRLIEDAQA